MTLSVVVSTGAELVVLAGTAICCSVTVAVETWTECSELEFELDKTVIVWMTTVPVVVFTGAAELLELATTVTGWTTKLSVLVTTDAGLLLELATMVTGWTTTLLDAVVNEAAVLLELATTVTGWTTTLSVAVAADAEPLELYPTATGGAVTLPLVVSTGAALLELAITVTGCTTTLSVAVETGRVELMELGVTVVCTVTTSVVDAPAVDVCVGLVEVTTVTGWTTTTSDAVDVTSLDCVTMTIDVSVDCAPGWTVSVACVVEPDRVVVIVSSALELVMVSLTGANSVIVRVAVAAVKWSDPALPCAFANRNAYYSRSPWQAN